MDYKERLKELIADAINDGYMEFGDANEMFSFIIDNFMDDRDAFDTIQQFFPGIGETIESSTEVNAEIAKVLDRFMEFLNSEESVEDCSYDIEDGMVYITIVFNNGYVIDDWNIILDDETPLDYDDLVEEYSFIDIDE